MSTIKVNTIQHTTANGSNMTLFANGNVAMTTANTTLTVGSTTISNSGISVGGAAINPFGTGMRNRIINGDMRIDQRYAGTSNTVNSVVVQYNLDRWVLENQTDGTFTVRQMDSANTSASNYESGSAPAGFLNSMKLTVASADASLAASQYIGISQKIEGLNIADLDWGKSTAKPVTVSFWVKSSVTGSYICELYNVLGNQIYDTTYTINNANTWEYKTITISPPTSGTFLTNNNLGICLRFWLAAGSTYTGGSLNTWQNGFANFNNQVNWMGTLANTFYITGVQLEVGTVATPFEFRHYGQELALCQRYYYKLGPNPVATDEVFVNGFCDTTINFVGFINHPVPMRVAPTLITTGTASDYSIRFAGSNVSNATAIPVLYGNAANIFGARMDTSSSSLVAGYGAHLRNATTAGFLAFNAEL